MNLKIILTRIGLTEKETDIYLSLLKHGEATASEIHRDTDIKRPTVYVCLEKLCQKGFSVPLKRGKKLVYHPINPEDLLEKKQQDLEQLEGVLPDLSKLNDSLLNTPQTSIFQGLEGIQNVMEHTLSSATEILTWTNIDLIYQSKEIGQLRGDVYNKRRVEKGIWGKSIYNYGEVALKLKKQGKKMLRESYILPKNSFPFQNEIKIWDDKIASISTIDMVGVIIQNKHISHTYRSIFKQHWEFAKNNESKILSPEDLKYLSS